MFKFAKGYTYTIDAEVAGAELARIEARDGAIRAPVVVDEARPVAAPLHDVFEWRDDVAAEAHRESQARRLIRAVIEVPESAPTRRAYTLTVTPTAVPAYQSTRVVVGDEALRAAALDRLVGNIRGCARGLAELARECGPAWTAAAEELDAWVARVDGIAEDAG